MGQKTVNIIGGLSGAVLVASVAVFFLPMHRVSFFTAFVVRAMRIETHLLTVELGEDHSDFCTLVNKLRPGTCSSGTFDLQDVYQRFCAPAVAKIYPQGCLGFHAAFNVGVGLATALVLNAVVLVAVLFALHSYINGKNHKRSYRRLALVLLVLTTVQLAAMVSFYSLFVFSQLDNMRPQGAGFVGALVFKASEGIGASFGFFACVIIVLVQLFMLVIWHHTKTGEEQGDDEIAERKLFEREAALMGYGSAGDAGPAPPQVPPQMGYGAAADGGQMLYQSDYGGGGMGMGQMPDQGDFVVFSQQGFADTGSLFLEAFGAGAETWPATQPQEYQPVMPSDYESKPAALRRGNTCHQAPPSALDA